MRGLDAELEPGDGVRYFNRLYLATTVEIRRRRRGAAFEDAEFLDRLDVEFANLYFEAHRAAEEHRELPATWRTVFRLRSKPETLPIQFALAGMNVHINHDLPVAVFRICQVLDRVPSEQSAAYRDFATMNNILADVNVQVRNWFESGVIATMDAACGRLDDALELWSLAEARRRAWRHAQLMWRLREHPSLQEAYLESLTSMVDVATKGILI